jgi:D-alanyl-D-alanine carboxypeptidase (penicillin-binding protein 5/6)
MAKPARRLSVFIAALAALIGSTLARPAAAAGLYNEPRYAAIVVDASSGEVLYARRADQPRYPASVSKVMSLYLVFEALANGKLHLDDRVVMSENGARQPPSKLGLRPGQSISVDEAVRSMALLSANDVAVAMAEKIGGTEARFASLMTLRAHELGMVNSRFVNPHGLPDTRQISTARDIAILSRAIMRDYPQYYAYFGQRTYDLQGRTLTNHNGLLRSMPGVDGIKTGFTNASGYNLAASAVRDGRRLITVVMGGTSTNTRNRNVEELLDAGFDVLAKRKAGQNITIAANLREPDDVSGPYLGPAGDSFQLASAPANADTATRVGVSLSGAVPAAAITPGSFSSAWLRPAAFDQAQTAGLQTASANISETPAAAQPLAAALQEVNCEPVKVTKTKVVKTKARKGKKARSRTVQAVSWQRPKACGPAPVAVVAKASLIKPQADNPAVVEKPVELADEAPAPKAACPTSTRTRAARNKRAACLRAAKADAAAEAKSSKSAKGSAKDASLRGSQSLNAQALKGKSDGSYAIQVGAFKSQADAKSQLGKIAKKYGSVVASAGTQVDGSKGGTYRARFKGFSAAEAKAACKALTAKGEHCMVLSAS